MILTDLAYGYFEYDTYAKYFMFATDEPVNTDFDKFRTEYFNFFGFKTDFGIPPELKNLWCMYYISIPTDKPVEDTQFFTYIHNWTQLFRALSKTYYIPESQLLKTWFHLKTTLCVANPKLVYFADKSFKEFEEIQRTHKVYTDLDKLLSIGTGIVVHNDHIDLCFFGSLTIASLKPIENILNVNWNIKTELGSLDQTYGMLRAFIANPIISKIQTEQDKYVHDMWNSITQLFQ